MNILLRHIIIILAGLFLCFCSSNESDYKRLVSEWQGKEIIIPDVMTDFLTGDTIDLSDADFTILAYVDSTGCTGCKMKLPLWKELLGSLDSVCESDVKFLMVVDPSGIGELNYNLKRDDFDYPIYIDDDNKVSKTNIFPEKEVLHTFLLDKNKKVIAIGNPLYSFEIAMLYRNIIDGKMYVSAETGDYISINDSRICLGNLHPGEEKSREIVFTNHSSDTVSISKVISSCECTKLSLPTEYISPISNLKAVVHFIGDTITGYFYRTVHIHYSEYTYPTILTITGNIIQ